MKEIKEEDFKISTAMEKGGIRKLYVIACLSLGIIFFLTFVFLYAFGFIFGVWFGFAALFMFLLLQAAPLIPTKEES